MEQAFRWEQRFSNYGKAVGKLRQAVKYIKDTFIQEGEYVLHAESVLDEVLKEEVIQRFEYTHELA